jgi:hypothetical protein
MSAANATTVRTETSLGELVAAFYQEFLALYGDPELASVATASIINDMLSDEALPDEQLSNVA